MSVGLALMIALNVLNLGAWVFLFKFGPPWRQS